MTSDSTAKASSGAHPAVPVEQGADWAGDKQYAENPDKPDPSTIAQVEILPEDK